MTVRLRIEAGPHAELSRPAIARRARAMLSAVELPEAEWSIVLTGDDQIRDLNRTYRHKDRPTDVLAFAQREGDFGDPAGGLLGDVIISVPTARRQAATARRPVMDEVTMLMAHGLLHLLGWDHDTPARDARMRRETERLIAAARAGQSPPIARRPPALRGRPPPGRARSRT